MEPAKFTPRQASTSAPTITVTERAATEIKQALTVEGETYAGVKLGVMGGGCCGPSYGLALAKGPEAGDQVVESHGVKIFVDPAESERLKGIKLDFVETPRGAGFHIENPNAVADEHSHGQGGGGCGCGGHGGGHGHGAEGGCACGSGGCGC